MATISGVIVNPNDLGTNRFNVPSIQDIIIGLSRVHRFAGQTKTPCNVLAHTFATAEVLEAIKCKLLNNTHAKLSNGIVRLGLLHDACEAIVSDTPSPFKSSEARQTEGMITQHVLDAYAGAYYNDLDWAVLNAVDTYIAHEEAIAYGLRVGDEPELIHNKRDMLDYARVHLTEVGDEYINDDRVIDFIMDIIFDYCGVYTRKHMGTPMVVGIKEYEYCETVFTVLNKL